MPAVLEDSVDAGVVKDLARRLARVDDRFDARGFAERTMAACARRPRSRIVDGGGRRTVRAGSAIRGARRHGARLTGLADERFDVSPAVVDVGAHVCLSAELRSTAAVAGRVVAATAFDVRL